MENMVDAIAAAPALAPGLIVGLIGGVLYGLNEDRKAGDVPHRWWTTGPLGAVIGAGVWMMILIGS